MNLPIHVDDVSDDLLNEMLDVPTKYWSFGRQKNEQQQPERWEIISLTLQNTLALTRTHTHTYMGVWDLNGNQNATNR